MCAGSVLLQNDVCIDQGVFLRVLRYPGDNDVVVVLYEWFSREIAVDLMDCSSTVPNVGLALPLIFFR